MTILDAMNAAPRRHKPSYEVTDYGAKFESGGSLAGLDLPPALNRMHCRLCGRKTKRAKCSRCKRKGLQT